jgi:polypeptide N-acetylgalactosaminyltransferase
METGTGDYGKQVNWGKDEEDAVRKSIKEFGFNMVMSDKISLDRVPKDIRDPKCKYVDYPEKLPEVSVVIVFHNEGWSTLMRTVHSVIKQTPKELLGEVVMVDDASTKGKTYSRDFLNNDLSL